MMASASSSRPPPDPNPPYTFQTPPPQWAAYDLPKPTHRHTKRRIIRTPRDPGILIYVAAANETTIETHEITTQRPKHHDTNTTPIPLLSSNLNPVDNPVKSTFGSTKRRIIRTQPKPSTRTYAGVYAAAPTSPHAIKTQERQHDTTYNKPIDQTFQQLHPEDHEPCSAGHTLNNSMLFRKNSALLRYNPKLTNIYNSKGNQMDSSLKPSPDDSDRHQQLNLLVAHNRCRTTTAHWYNDPAAPPVKPNSFTRYYDTDGAYPQHHTSKDSRHRTTPHSESNTPQDSTQRTPNDPNFPKPTTCRQPTDSTKIPQHARHYPYSHHHTCQPCGHIIR